MLRNMDGKQKLCGMQHDMADAECRMLSVSPMQMSKFRLTLLVLLSVCTCGLLLLFVWWYIKLRRMLMYAYCEIEEATHALVQGGGMSTVCHRI